MLVALTFKCNAHIYRGTLLYADKNLTYCLRGVDALATRRHAETPIKKIYITSSIVYVAYTWY